MKKESYKEPVFLFTSSSMRQAAWAGWYSALGDKENAEKFRHATYSEWAKEISAGRKFSFSERYSNDIYHLDPEILKKMTDKYLKDIGAEIKKKKIIEMTHSIPKDGLLEKNKRTVVDFITIDPDGVSTKEVLRSLKKLPKTVKK